MLGKSAITVKGGAQGGAQISEKLFEAVRALLGGRGHSFQKKMKKMNIKWGHYVVGIPGTFGVK